MQLSYTLQKENSIHMEIKDSRFVNLIPGMPTSCHWNYEFGKELY